MATVGWVAAVVAWFRPHVAIVRMVAVLTIMLLTCWFMGRQIYLAYAELATRPLSIRYDYLALAFAVDLLATFLLVGPFAIGLIDRYRLQAPAAEPNQRLTWSAIWQAYIISQVGKYVPGKAVVLVIRYMVLGRLGISFGVVVLATFFETIGAMAAAALLSFLLLTFSPSTAGSQSLAQLPWLWPTSLFLFLGLGFLVIPPVLAQAPRAMSRIAPSARRHADTPIGWGTVGWSLLSGLIAWCAFGASFWAVVQSVSPKPLPLAEIPTLTAVFCFSYVAGFLSLVPGHFGVREFIMDLVLRPMLGGDRLVAVSATLLSRLVTLTVELLLALVAYGIYRATTARLAPPSPTSHTKMESEEATAPNE
jgi:uncharacterized membrane protein YbhN (UPF0104 family)